MIFSVDGHQAYAATGGQPLNPQGPVVVFLHGAGMDHSVWTLAARYVAHHGASALALDLPGHGRSAGTPPADIAAAAQWLWRALDGLGVKRAILIGHSMGALIALEAARRAPERIAKLMLVGFAPKMPVHPDLLAAAKANDPKAAALIASWGFGTAGHMGGNRTPGLAMLPLGLRLVQRAPAGTLHADLAACNAYPGAEPVAALNAPVLLLQGADDRMTPAKAAAGFVAKLPRAETRLLDGVGHMVMAEAPDALTAAVKDFVLV
jgi:pimeloyl-ACP methyl ester carboxylesterase